MANMETYLVAESENIFYCMICNCRMTSWEKAELHLQEDYHLITASDWGNDILMLTETHNYYCVCCERHILGYLNVYPHIMGRRHINRVRELEIAEFMDNPNVY